MEAGAGQPCAISPTSFGPALTRLHPREVLAYLFRRLGQWPNKVWLMVPRLIINHGYAGKSNPTFGRATSKCDGTGVGFFCGVAIR